jgi:NADH-quinone oxidoreductase subunit C
MNSDAILPIIQKDLGEWILREHHFLDENTIETEKAHLKKVLLYLKNNLGFTVLMDLTGIDYLVPIKQTKVLYWLHHPIHFYRIRVVVYVKREEKLPSSVDLWEGANWYERELFDLFGVHFEGHPDLKRILMPDDWKGHPLQKDYALTEQPVEFKHGVKPKVPSDIIHVKRQQKMY